MKHTPFLYDQNSTKVDSTTPYKDEYFQIQQMNNQLINSQRALMKSNQRLQNALQEVRSANSRISLLERDELTGLFTISAFYQHAQKELDQHPLVSYDIIILNLQKFKRVNETFGRVAGNLLLKNFSIFLLGLPHAEDGLFARSSAAFYILMPSALAFHEILAEKSASFIRNYPLSLQMHTAIGIYQTDFERLPIETMCDRALLAIDSIANRKESLVSFYDHTLHNSLKLEHLILDHVQEALHDEEFLLYLQPKVLIEDGSIIGAEALVRWEHPTLGWITPDKFIPLLEKNDLIYELDQYIWEKACQVLSFQKRHELPLTPISVNAARSDLYQPDLLDVLQNLMCKYTLNPENLHIEIIERAYVNDSSRMFQILKGLRKSGFPIEMDDFGTGESSLSMISEMPVDYLKLDRAFLTSSLSDKRHTEIIRFIINLASALDMSVIAEGVETQEQADLLLSLGCKNAQGYYYGKPQPSDEFLRLFV